jgi:hypothetical protein
MRIDLNSGILECVGAKVSGDITATSLTLSECTIPAGKIDGLSSVATSGNYNDLSGKPTIPDSSEVMYKRDITQSIQQDEYGNNYLETKVLVEDGKCITYATYDAGDCLIFGYSRGIDSDGKNYICISKEGLLTARNALIYGTIYATDGEFAGKITANEGKIGNWFIGSNGLYDAAPTGTTSVFLVPKGKNISGKNFVISVGNYDNFNTGSEKNLSYFGVTTGGKLYAKGGEFKGTLNAWSGYIGGCTISSGSIKGSNDIWTLSSDGKAKFKGINIDGYDLNVVSRV